MNGKSIEHTITRLSFQYLKKKSPVPDGFGAWIIGRHRKPSEKQTQTPKKTSEKDEREREGKREKIKLDESRSHHVISID